MMPNCADDVRAAYPLFQTERGGSTPTSALQLTVEQINPRLAMDLNAKWHSALPETYLGNIVGNARSACYAAQFHDIWYAVAIWTNPIAANRMNDAENAIELRRFAIADDAPKFTASRMLRVMILLLRKKWPELRRFISYQAVNCHKGTIYKAAGWKPTATSEPQEWKGGNGRSHRELQIVSDKVRWELNLVAPQALQKGT